MKVARLAMVLSGVIEQLMDQKIIDQNFSQLNMGLFFTFQAAVAACGATSSRGPSAWPKSSSHFSSKPKR